MVKLLLSLGFILLSIAFATRCVRSMRHEFHPRFGDVFKTIAFLALAIVSLVGCGADNQNPQESLNYRMTTGWQIAEPEAIERPSGVRPDISDLKHFTFTWTSKHIDITMGDRWPTAHEVERAGMRSNCVGLTNHTYRMIRDHFNIADGDLWCVIYRRRGGLHTILGVETTTGHWWHDRSFGPHGRWFQGGVEPIFWYNIFDCGSHAPQAQVGAEA